MRNARKRVGDELLRVYSSDQKYDCSDDDDADAPSTIEGRHIRTFLHVYVHKLCFASKICPHFNLYIYLSIYIYIYIYS